MNKFAWSRLNKNQAGRFAEYYSKMEFALWGFEIFNSEVDDRGIDFVVRHNNASFIEIQTKSARTTKYVFMQEAKFTLSPQRYLSLVILKEYHAPEIYLVPSLVWKNPSSLFVYRQYPGLKSKPEYGVQMSGKTMPLLQQFSFDKVVIALMNKKSPRVATRGLS